MSDVSLVMSISGGLIVLLVCTGLALILVCCIRRYCTGKNSINTIVVRFNKDDENLKKWYVFFSQVNYEY